MSVRRSILSINVVHIVTSSTSPLVCLAPHSGIPSLRRRAYSQPTHVPQVPSAMHVPQNCPQSSLTHPLGGEMGCGIEYTRSRVDAYSSQNLCLNALLSKILPKHSSQKTLLVTLFSKSASQARCPCFCS